MEFWKTKQFKLLASEWDQKLKESGFKDAETQSANEERVLAQRASKPFDNARSFERESILEYYCLVGHLAHNTAYPNKIEELVMVRHSEGATITEITNDIKKYGFSRDRRTIRFIIRRWQMKWGIRHWSLKQMYLRKVHIK